MYHCPHLLASKGFSIVGNTKNLASASYFTCRHLSVQSSVIQGYENVFMPIITGANPTPKVRLVSVVCMQENLGKPTYPSNLKITLIINKNSLLDFRIHVDYSVRSLLKERKGSEF